MVMPSLANHNPKSQVNQWDLSIRLGLLVSDRIYHRTWFSCMLVGVMVQSDVTHSLI